MRWLFAARLRPFVALAATASLVLNVMLLVPAIYMLQVFDRVFTSRSLETLAMLSILVLLALALAYAMDVARARALAWCGASIDRELAPAALAAALEQAALASHTRDAAALKDVAALRTFLSGSAITALFDAPWVPLFLLVIASMHPLLGIASGVGAAMLFGLALLTDLATRRAAENAQSRSRGLQRRTQSLLRNAEVIAGMGMTASALRGWQSRQQTLHEARDQHGEHSARLTAAARIVRQALQAALLGIGAWLVIGEHASPGIMIASTILFGRALQPIEQLIAGWKGLVEARAAWRRLSESGSAAGRGERLQLPAPQGAIELERVLFAPNPHGAPVIKGVSLRLAAGESMGVVGASASGKTTLLRLLLGIWKPNAGSVRLDGADVAQWDRDTLGRHVGYLPQDVELFDGTVAENIARLGEIDDERVIEAARLAQAHEMILRLPGGYETPVGEAGAALSGGQRQRIALARALYGTPRLVVLDEPNANLDAEGDAALASALRTLKQRGATVVVVSHRTALLAHVDKLAVLKDGALEAFGPVTQVDPKLRPIRSVVSPPPRGAVPAKADGVVLPTRGGATGNANGVVPAASSGGATAQGSALAAAPVSSSIL